jgi:hypothetical protein
MMDLNRGDSLSCSMRASCGNARIAFPLGCIAKRYAGKEELPKFVFGTRLEVAIKWSSHLFSHKRRNLVKADAFLGLRVAVSHSDGLIA